MMQSCIDYLDGLKAGGEDSMSSTVSHEASAPSRAGLKDSEAAQGITSNDWQGCVPMFPDASMARTQVL